MTEVEKILYALGYFDSDAPKKEQILGYITEATEFMTEAGVPSSLLTSQRAFAIKSLWSDARDKGEASALVQKDGMIVHLISQMRR